MSGPGTGAVHPSRVHRPLPGERVLWQGRPSWRAVARDVLHIRLVALYLGGMLVWGAADDRAAGLGRGQAVMAAMPSMVLGLAVLGACVAFAWAIARTTRYTVTSERCLIEYGIALEATLSVPWRRVAAVSLALSRDGTGSIPLTLKPGQEVSALKLWPHLRLRRCGLGRAEPMLRGVPDAARVGELVARAVRAVSPGRVTPLPDLAGAAPPVTTPAAGAAFQEASEGAGIVGAERV